MRFRREAFPDHARREPDRLPVGRALHRFPRRTGPEVGRAPDAAQARRPSSRVRGAGIDEQQFVQRDVELPRQRVERVHRWFREAPFHLGDQARRHAEPVGERPQAQPAGRAGGAQPVADLAIFGGGTAHVHGDPYAVHCY